jgi:hypothetical protein
MNLGTDYAIGKPMSYNTKQLIIKTDHAINQLDEHLRNRYRIIAHKKLKQTNKSYMTTNKTHSTNNNTT